VKKVFLGRLSLFYSFRFRLLTFSVFIAAKQPDLKNEVMLCQRIRRCFWTGGFFARSGLFSLLQRLGSWRRCSGWYRARQPV